MTNKNKDLTYDQAMFERLSSPVNIHHSRKELESLTSRIISFGEVMKDPAIQLSVHQQMDIMLEQYADMCQFLAYHATPMLAELELLFKIITGQVDNR